MQQFIDNKFAKLKLLLLGGIERKMIKSLNYE
jgi:hypothetical protein